jgi:putative phosphoesterase
LAFYGILLKLKGDQMLYVISDLHYEVNQKGDAVVERLAKLLNSRSSSNDVLAIAGDIGADDNSVQQCLSLFKSFKGTKCAIAGNHDVWTDNSRSSMSRYTALSEIMRSENFHPLEDAPLNLEGFSLVGTMGWYDYSFADDLNIPRGEYEAKHSPSVGVSWMDRVHARWGVNDLAVTHWQNERLRTQLAQATSKKVVAITHHLPTKKLLFHPRCLLPKALRFANAFLGNNTMGEILCNDGRVKQCFSGHIHWASSCTIGETRFHTVGGSYTQKELIAYDGQTVTRETLS